MIVKEVLDKTTQFFRDKKIESPRLDSELLIASALGLRRIDLYLKFEQPLKDQEVQLCRDYVRRRSQGEPVAYILGRKDFYGLSFLVDNRVLIPRPETELIVEKALQFAKEKNLPSPRVLDLGCGSGCIGLAIKKNIPTARLTLLDKSEGAIEVARHNSQALELTEDVELICADALAWNPEARRFDIIVANPPYIDKADLEVEANVKAFEPAGALFSEKQGLADIFGWSAKYLDYLEPNGVMLFEMGYLQGPAVVEHFQNLNQFNDIKLLKDMAALDRVVMAEKK